jgi:hypothetical protein
VTDSAEGLELEAVLTNEFASVAIRVDRSANGPRLKIIDLFTGREIYLDPMEVASLTAIESHTSLDSYVVLPNDGK